MSLTQNERKKIRTYLSTLPITDKKSWCCEPYGLGIIVVSSVYDVEVRMKQLGLKLPLIFNDIPILEVWQRNGYKLYNP